MSAAFYDMQNEFEVLNKLIKVYIHLKNELSYVIGIKINIFLFWNPALLAGLG